MPTFTANAATELFVRVDEGHLSLRGGDFPAIEARLDASDDIAYEDVGFRQDGARVVLDVKAEANIELRVPRGLRVTLATGDGHVEADEFDGSLEARTDDGHMQIRGRFDLLKLTTDDGHIEVEADRGSRMSEGWTLRTDDGSITLRLPRDFAADLDARTDDGSISVDFPLTEGDVHKRSVKGKINGGGPMLTLRTEDGSIEIESD